MTGPVPKKIKPHITKSPEEVAAHESMKINHLYPKSQKPGRTGLNKIGRPKSIKHSNKSGGIAKKSEPDPTLTMDIFTLRQKPMSIAAIEQIAFKLVNWAMSKKQVIIDEFLQQEGYSDGAFRHLRSRSPKLEEAFQFAKMCIGNKREKGALYNKMNAALVMKSLPDYSVRWKKLVKWHADITAKDTNIQQGIQVVEIQKAEETDIVKPLPKKDKDNG